MVLGRFKSLSDNKEFAEIYKNGKKWHCLCAVVFFAKFNSQIGFSPKFSVVVSKKFGKAHERNLAKRRVRAAFYALQNRLEEGVFVVVVKNNLKTHSFLELSKQLAWSLRRLEALKN